MRLSSAAFATIGFLLTVSAGRADVYDDANEAGSVMAAVKSCQATISTGLRRDLSVKLLALWKVPSQVSYIVDKEVAALKRMPAEDRIAMCEAIKMRIEALEAVTIKK